MTFVLVAWTTCAWAEEPKGIDCELRLSHFESVGGISYSLNVIFGLNKQYNFRWTSPDGKEMGQSDTNAQGEVISEGFHAIEAHSLEELKSRVDGDWTLSCKKDGLESIYHFKVDLSEITEDQLGSVLVTYPPNHATLPTLRPTIKWKTIRPLMGRSSVDFSTQHGGSEQSISEPVNLSVSGSYTVPTDQPPGRYSFHIECDLRLSDQPMTFERISGPELPIGSGYFKCEYNFQTGASITTVAPPAAQSGGPVAALPAPVTPPVPDYVLEQERQAQEASARRAHAIQFLAGFGPTLVVVLVALFIWAYKRDQQSATRR